MPPVDINRPSDDQQYTALEHVIMAGERPMVKMLLSRGVSVDLDIALS